MLGKQVHLRFLSVRIPLKAHLKWLSCSDSLCETKRPFYYSTLLALGDKADIVKEQQSCYKLHTLRNKVNNGDVIRSKYRATRHKMIDGLIHRECIDSVNEYDTETSSLAVLLKDRPHVINHGHDALWWFTSVLR